MYTFVFVIFNFASFLCRIIEMHVNIFNLIFFFAEKLFNLKRISFFMLCENTITMCVMIQ